MVSSASVISCLKLYKIKGCFLLRKLLLRAESDFQTYHFNYGMLDMGIPPPPQTIFWSHLLGAYCMRSQVGDFISALK